MAPWYEEAEFYHIYPIGLTGAPRKNESEEPYTAFPHWNSGFRTSQISVVPQSISAPCLNQPHMDTTQKITNR